MHSHSHSHHRYDDGHASDGAAARRALWGALVLNGGFLIIEAGVGWWTGSLALLSDAAHMVSDVAALVLALVASLIARARPDENRTFGLKRAETLGAFLNGLALVLAFVWIFIEAGHRLTEGPPQIAGMPVLVVGAIGLAINLGSAWFLWRSNADDLNVRGALWHMLADALGSVGAVGAALLLMAGLPAADAVISVVIGLMVAWAGWGLLRDAGRVLLQLPPTGLDVDALARSLELVEGVESVHDVHAWTLDGQQVIVTAHLVTPRDDWDVVRAQAGIVLAERFGVHHATLQVERPLTMEGAGGCTQDCGTHRRAGPESNDHGHHHAHGHAG